MTRKDTTFSEICLHMPHNNSKICINPAVGARRKPGHQKQEQDATANNVQIYHIIYISQSKNRILTLSPIDATIII